jgi:hypothetical protein
VNIVPNRDDSNLSLLRGLAFAMIPAMMAWLLIGVAIHALLT